MKKNSYVTFKTILIFAVSAIVAYTVTSISFELQDTSSAHARPAQQTMTTISDKN